MLSREERETVIVINEAEDYAQVYSCSQPMIRKLRELSLSYPRNYDVKKEDNESITCRVDKKLVKLAKPMSEETRAKRSKIAKRAFCVKDDL